MLQRPLESALTTAIRMVQKPGLWVSVCQRHREVPGPDPVRLCHHELAIESVLGNGQPVIRLGGGPPPLHGLGPDAVLAHQPSDAMLTDAMPLFDQGLPDAGTAVGLAGLTMDHPDG